LTRRRRLLIANPGADVYGSDLQMLESITAMIQRDWEVTVATPSDGPLTHLIRERGARVEFADYPVIQRAHMSPSGVIRLAIQGGRAAIHLRRTVRRLSPDVVYVNTVTIPWWLIAARTCRVPVTCHIHEAEISDPLPVQIALYGPLVLASALIAISTSAVEATSLVPLTHRGIRLIYNGVEGPKSIEPGLDSDIRPFRLLCLGRLSPRKGTDVALEAAALLRRDGHDVLLEVGGTPFPGYEWFEKSLRERADQPDLRGAVVFSGYVSPVWPAFARAHAILAPSLREPFGNVVVEAQLSERPVIASAAMGHLETIQHECTGLLVEPSNARAMADAVLELMNDPDLATRLASQGRRRAEIEYSPARYRTQIADLLCDLALRRGRTVNR
jgi:glycosyltransferase involved in cell wall biosynthesis